MANITHIANEVALEQVLFKTETIPGVPVVPTHRMMGTFTATPGRGAIRRTEEATGGFDRLGAPSREAADPSGSYSEEMTFESFPQQMRYGVQGGGTGVTDGETVPGYTYAKSPSFDVDDVDSFTAQFGVNGLAWQAAGVRWDEFNIAADAVGTGDVLMFSGTPFIREVTRLPGFFDGIATGGSTSTAVQTGAGWSANEWAGGYFFQDYGSHVGEVRMILSNTTDTLTLGPPVLGSAVAAADRYHLSGLMPVIGNPDYEKISLEGSNLYLDRYNPSATTIGTTDVSPRILSLNLTQTLNLARKRRLPGIIGRVGRGGRWITGTIRFELDRWDEYKAWEELTPLSIRWEKEGSIIDPSEGTRKLARLDIERAYLDTFTPDADNNNRTGSFSFIARLADSEPIATFLGKNRLATLP